jgi:tRNA (cmo5U34)-methyltransferase
LEEFFMKSSVDEIRARFDGDVERFSNLETGQAATMDARLCMELVTSAAAAVTPGARALLDIGCGAGNYTLLMLSHLPKLECTLIDLSLPMLQRARERVVAAGGREPATMQGDMRELDLGTGTFDIVLTAAALHHLRSDAEWEGMFGKIFASLRPGGSFWVFDYIEQETAAVQGMMMTRFGEYLVGLKGGGEAGEKYRDHVFAYVEAEDTPRSLGFQMKLIERVGFEGVEVLHKNSLFAAFGARKA